MKTISVMKDGSFALGCPNYVNSAVLGAASTAIDIVVPSTLGATHVFFSADCNFAVRYNTGLAGTAAVYGTSSVSDGSACELNPTVRFIGKGQIGALSVIAPTSGVVTASFYNSGST